jgi:hypothetical protein
MPSTSHTIAKVARSAPGSTAIRAPTRARSIKINPRHDAVADAVGASGGLAVRTTRASRTSDALRAPCFSRDAHHCSVLAEQPSRRLNTSARSPLARHASTRFAHRRAASLMHGTMRPLLGPHQNGARAADTHFKLGPSGVYHVFARAAAASNASE